MDQMQASTCLGLVRSFRVSGFRQGGFVRQCSRIEFLVFSFPEQQKSERRSSSRLPECELPEQYEE